MNATLSLSRPFARQPAGPSLPVRVLKALEQEQYRAELLVTAVQLALALILAILYASTPPGFSPDAPVEAAPLGLVLFGELALLRLYFALTGQLRGQLGRGFLGFTVVAEMAVLMGVLWAYHLQYEQAPQFSLKSTPFVYVFVLIGLRALRFEPLWVILSGLTAAVGWAAMLAYAVLAAPTNPVTWDYVTSLRSTQIHFGGEFDKLMAIVVVTLVLALALARARRLLAQAVSGQQAAADLSLFFDDSVARRITQSEAEVMAGQGELRDAAIVFFDMRGFTQAAATLTPTELIALLGEYQALVVPIVKTHGGIIDKFMGDGLATGEVVFGIIGVDKRLEYTVIGDAVNLAAKLEKHNKAEATRGLTTAATYALAASQGYGGRKEILAWRAVGGVAERLDLAVIARHGRLEAIT